MSQVRVTTKSQCTKAELYNSQYKGVGAPKVKLKTEEGLKNESDPKEEDKSKNEDEPKIKDYTKNGNDPKMEITPKMRIIKCSFDAWID